MIFYSKKTHQLNRKEILKILNLKDEKWKFGLSSQKKFFKRNIKKFDIHNFFYISPKKNKLIGYTCFRLRHLSIENKKIKYMLLDSIIVNKDFQKKKYGRKLMKLNNTFIKKKRLPSFLFCSQKNSKFFKLFKWKVVPKKNFKISNKTKKKQMCMFYNSNLSIKDKKIFVLTI